jgi:hypothetical protein
VAQRIDDLTGLDCRRYHHLSELLLAADCRNGSPQVGVGMPDGLKHDSAIQRDGLVSLEKARLTDYVGELTSDTLSELDHALSLVLALPRRCGFMSRRIAPVSRIKP